MRLSVIVTAGMCKPSVARFHPMMAFLVFLLRWQNGKKLALARGRRPHLIVEAREQDTLLLIFEGTERPYKAPGGTG